MGWSHIVCVCACVCVCVCVCFHTGNPSIKKCKEARKKREETQELAALDVSNIIATQGNFLFFCFWGVFIHYQMPSRCRHFQVAKQRFLFTLRGKKNTNTISEPYLLVDYSIGR